MNKFKHYIINEKVYDGNIGFAEMAKFYQIASKEDIKKMEVAIKAESWKEFKNLIYSVLKVKLK